MINNDMKIKDILLESPTDVVARFYKEAGHDYEKFYNPEVVKYQEKNSKYYDEYFKKWFNEDIVPIFTKPVDKPQPAYTNAPKESKLQSPGYRGLQHALAAAGLPYNHNVQDYETNPNRMLASQTMDGARNNNGQ
jgi:hypothetical protein